MDLIRAGQKLSTMNHPRERENATSSTPTITASWAKPAYPGSSPCCKSATRMQEGSAPG
jgi:hypothetical protein